MIPERASFKKSILRDWDYAAAPKIPLSLETLDLDASLKFDF